MFYIKNGAAYGAAAIPSCAACEPIPTAEPTAAPRRLNGNASNAQLIWLKHNNNKHASCMIFFEVIDLFYMSCERKAIGKQNKSPA